MCFKPQTSELRLNLLEKRYFSSVERDGDK